MSFPWARLLGAAAVALLLVVARPVAAEPANAARRALELAYEGDALYARGDWARAYEKFASAEATAHSPVFVLYMARARKNEGRLREARTLYRRAAGESVSDQAPKAFRQAVADAAVEERELTRRIPSLIVRAPGIPSADLRVRVDGAVVADSQPLELDPGRHEVVAEHGTQRVVRSVTLVDRATPVDVVLSFPRPAMPSATRNSAIAGFVLGALGLALGGVTGAVAAAKASHVKPGCVGVHCLEKDAGELDTARTFAAVSTGGFIVGGVGIAAGGLLLIVRPGEGAPASPRTTSVRLAVEGSF